MKKIKGQYRQGDVLVQECEPPTGADRIPSIDGKVVLANGEVTGHAHTISAEKADWWKTDRGIGITAKPGAVVRHQEHGPITLSPKPHRIIRQREYTPGEIRRVAD